MLQKKYEDYLEEVYKLFPDVEESSVKSIIEHGLKKVYDTVKVGMDVKLIDKGTQVFIGQSDVKGSQQWTRSKLKEHTKRRRIFLDQKIPWDRWHYFGLTEKENELFIQTGEITSVQLYKLLKESIIRKDVKYVYRTDLGYTIPENIVPWRESKDIVKLEDCELSEEGKKLIDLREYRKAINLKYKSKDEEDSTE